ncbi:hypothetical protein ABZ896_23000 [Streptomyces sp. NPDC047072]|uniref:hypothetical protein n=1 Tax=Streptomyces sp. NPDC047072 TaxID=3154809 RepID=UPI003404F1FD
MFRTLVPVPGSYAQTELRLLRRSSFTAVYLPQVIDFVVRGVVGSEFAAPGEQQAVQIHRHLVRYAASGQPGFRELARAMLNVRHAAELVQHEHYRASAIPAAGPAFAVCGRRLMELAADAGRDRVLPAQGGALVVAEPDGHSTVYRPVPAAEARDIRVAARSAKEEATRLHERVVGALSPHVRMADWSRDEGYGVAVDIVPEAEMAVSVQWWPASIPQSRVLWEQGGIRQLCSDLLSNWFRVAEGPQGILQTRNVA